MLTDYGRQRLATANSAFNISSYSLGDDEVDYRLIKKYGRTVGKEKIEKNTPIFEALTNQNIALKYKLVGRESSAVTISTIIMPYLTVTKSPATLTSTTTTSVTVKFNYESADATLKETEYKIKVSDRFFTLTGNGITAPATSVSNAGDPNRTAIYRLVPGVSATNSYEFSFTINPKAIDKTALSIYGKLVSGTTRQIDSYVTLSGVKTGCTLDIPVSYQASI